MKKPLVLAAVGTLVGLTGLLVFLSGCGGGGGSISVPPVPPTPTTSEAFLALLPAAQKGATYVGSAACIACHTDPASGAPQIDLVAFQATKHNNVGVGCEQCHGPGSAHKAGPSTDTILTMPVLANSAVCAQCHAPMAAQTKDSKHSSFVASPVNSSSWQTCQRCHSGAFNADMIGMPHNEGKTAAQIDTAILALTAADKPGFVAATTESASCVTCHAAMRQTANLTWKDGKQAQLRFKEANTDTTLLATMPALVGNYTGVDQMCGRCHNGRSISGSDATLLTSASANMHDAPQYHMLLGLGGSELGGGPPSRTTAHAAAPGQCAHCHMPNANHTMTVNLETSCAPCHTAGDAAARYALRGAIEAQLVTLRTRMQTWATAALGNLNYWDYRQAPDQTKVPIEIKRARHNYYFVLRDASYGIHNSTYTRYLLQTANTNIDALGVRSVKIDMTPAQIKATLAADKMRSMQDGHGAD